MYLFITLIALDSLCLKSTFLLIFPNLLHLIRILSANNSSPFLSSVSIISLNKLLTSGVIFLEFNVLFDNNFGEAIVLTTEI